MGYNSSLYQIEVVLWYLFGQDKKMQLINFSHT